MFHKKHKFVAVSQMWEHKACKEPPSQNVAKAAPQAQPQATGRAWKCLQKSIDFWLPLGMLSKVIRSTYGSICKRLACARCLFANLLIFFL